LPPVGTRKTSTHTLLDHRTLQLGKDAHHLKQRFARRCSRVQPLLMQEQVDTGGVELGQEADQVLQATAETVDRPRHHHIDLAPGGSLNECIERRALGK
jgi:hypothetical protein